MSLPSAFSNTCLPWQNFYLLTGTAAATLIGLMFIAITFGAGLVTAESLPTARSFIDPTFAHFVQILMTACWMLVPGMHPWLLGGLLLVTALWRAPRLLLIYRHMRDAHRRAGDIELSDWVSGIVAPLVAYLSLATAGVGFVLGWGMAFPLLAFVTVLLLLLGTYSAWETMVWMVLVRSRKSEDPGPQ